MNKKILFLFLFLFLKNIFCQEQNFEEELFKSNFSLRKIENNYLKSEILKYKIYWEFIPAGEAEIILKLEEWYGINIYHIITTAKSNKSIDVIYRVRNRTDSYIDFNGFYSLKFTKDQNEGGFVSKDYVLFDHKNNICYNLIDNTTTYIPIFVQDVISALYWLRIQEIKVGEKYTVDVWVGKIVYPMIIYVLNRQKIKILDQEYDCFKVEPQVDLKNFPLFKAKGRLFVYLTINEKIPVRLETRVFIGRVFADLVEKK